MILEGKKAKEFMPSIIGDEKSKIITPIKDILYTNEVLGHIILYDGQGLDIKDKLTYGRDFSQPQKDIGFLGSFLFVGTNCRFFHQLVNNRFTGKYKKDCVIIDRQFEGMVSYEFVATLKNYLVH